VARHGVGARPGSTAHAIHPAVHQRGRRDQDVDIADQLPGAVQLAVDRRGTVDDRVREREHVARAAPRFEGGDLARRALRAQTRQDLVARDDGDRGASVCRQVLGRRCRTRGSRPRIKSDSVSVSSSAGGGIAAATEAAP
jgi:hypothetical protein